MGTCRQAKGAGELLELEVELQLEAVASVCVCVCVYVRSVTGGRKYWRIN